MNVVKKLLIVAGVIGLLILVKNAFPGEWQGFWSWVFDIIV